MTCEKITIEEMRKEKNKAHSFLAKLDRLSMNKADGHPFLVLEQIRPLTSVPHAGDFLVPDLPLYQEDPIEQGFGSRRACNRIERLVVNSQQRMRDLFLQPGT